ncbi:TetR/AcrR family transcriptional regulator [Oricola cellulosilytica]|uniref:TetR/AcrR family transcriptional regulator n=1 Tax=Oricola cellulosilytica TaxID=1429082 RepID=A0A4R0PDD4_9HYPH|nr:TetR/AcrR family transcriptional regulator [Oricola cellulosilytica]TCD15502.1 TetR/AcrR family transcriptional regulator [Oricola cellulosilytica]
MNSHEEAGSKANSNGDDFAPRQADVLEAALALLVERGGAGLTTARLARSANCSKESIYKWFGDRDGLLAAMVTYQASKVGIGEPCGGTSSAAEFRAQLLGFAHDLLTVLSGPTSLALNRVAIGEAGHDDANLGGLLIERGRRMIERRASGLLEAGRAQGYLRFDDRDEAFNTLYGLIVGDLHVRLLLGDKVPAMASRVAIERQAATAISNFYRLYGAPETIQTVNT